MTLGGMKQRRLANRDLRKVQMWMLLLKFYELAVWERGVWGAPALPSNHKLSSYAPVHTHGNSIIVVVVDCSNIYYDSIRRNIRIQFTMYANLLILHSSTLY